MAKVISIALQKGGVGKSTTAQSLADTLGYKNKKVLLIDMDSQANVTYASGIEGSYNSITNVLAGDCAIDKAIYKCKYYDIIAADRYLANIERIESESPEEARKMNSILKNAIEPIKKNYDFIVIDTPPALGNLSFNSLMASDFVIVPLEPRPFALAGLTALNDTIKTVQTLNNNLSVLGILLIKWSNRTILNRQISGLIDEYAKELNTTVFRSTIREGISVPEAQTMQQPLIDYAENSNPCIDYKSFVDEVLKMIGE